MKTLNQKLSKSIIITLANLLIITSTNLLISTSIFAQAPEAFTYQAIVRNNLGQPLPNTSVTFQFNILKTSVSGTLVYSEEQTTTTNDFGLVNLQIGQGTVQSGNFSTIDWASDAYFLNIQLDQGSGFVDMGTQQFISVPYAMFAKNAGSSAAAGNTGDVQLNDNGSIGADPDLHWDFTDKKLIVGQDTSDGRMIIQQDINAPDSIPILEVKNKLGQTIFVVYPDSVHVFINDDGSKGPLKGGFAVSGRSGTKAPINDYLLVRPNSTRISFNKSSAKGVLKGGFAVSGRSGTKAGVEEEYFSIFPNDTASIISPSEARIIWYPQKNAFLAGQVLVNSPDSVGINSLSVGYETKAIGNYSQALGNSARAFGQNSTAIGYNANANGDNSYAFGNYANTDTNAIGSGAQANGQYSFAVGSIGVDSAGNATSPTIAQGNYSYAFGMGSVASNQGAFAFGTQDTASGFYSLAMGYHTKATSLYSTAMGHQTKATNYYSTAMGSNTTASGSISTAMGLQTTASGYYSTAMGYSTTASGDFSTAMGHQTTASEYSSTAMGYSTTAGGWYSTAMGYQTTASGDYSTAMGTYTTAQPYGSVVFGRYNIISGDTDTWVSTDPLFVIGNGSSSSSPHNAMTVLKNGEVYFPDVYTVAVGATNRDLYIDNTGKIGYLSSAKRFKKQIKPMEDISWLYKLRPVNYVYKSDQKGIKQYGLIAEEVEKINPLFVSYNKDGIIETVNYSQLITPMLKAIQDLKVENQQLKNKLSEIDNLKTEIEQLKSTIGITQK